VPKLAVIIAKGMAAIGAMVNSHWSRSNYLADDGVEGVAAPGADGAAGDVEAG
jgi:hypothetical protein